MWSITFMIISNRWCIKTNPYSLSWQNTYFVVIFFHYWTNFHTHVTIQLWKASTHLLTNITIWIELLVGKEWTKAVFHIRKLPREESECRTWRGIIWGVAGAEEWLSLLLCQVSSTHACYFLSVLPSRILGKGWLHVKHVDTEFHSWNLVPGHLMQFVKMP